LICGDHEGTGGIESPLRFVVTAIQGQVARAESPDLGKIAGQSKDQTVPATALLEQRAVSSRTGRCCPVLGNSLSGQSGASLQKGNPKGPQDELIRHLNEDGG
jgi:hypothetical protein